MKSTYSNDPSLNWREMSLQTKNLLTADWTLAEKCVVSKPVPSYGRAAGIRCISALRKLRSCRHQAGGKQQSTGLLHWIVRIPSGPLKIAIPRWGMAIFGGAAGIRTLAALSCPTRFRVTPLRPAWVLLRIYNGPIISAAKLKIKWFSLHLVLICSYMNVKLK